MSHRYVVIDSEGVAANVIIWDGESEWTPPEGHTVALENSDEGRSALLAATLLADETQQEQ
jgi:hypothetical protein